MNTELERCPFCQGVHVSLAQASNYITVQCEACQGSGPWHRGEAEAIAAWNRRAAQAPQAAEPVGDLTLRDWLVERELNCLSIAPSCTSDADKDGWLEDASYFRAAYMELDRIAALAPQAPAAQPLTWMQVDALVYQCRQQGDDSTYALCSAIERAHGIAPSAQGDTP